MVVSVPNPASTPRSISFGTYDADLRSGELKKGGERVRLQAQPFQLLVMLLERPGELVTREEICEKLWPTDTFVDFDHSLGTAINKIREVLGDSATEPRFVETLPRRGYRFIAPVTSVAEPPHEVSLPPLLESETNEEHHRNPALRRLIWAGVSAVLLIFVLVAWYFLRPHPIGSIAVLPLANLSANPDQEYFVDGMTDKLITNLAQLSSLRVVSRTSVMQYKNSRKPLLQIARELQVDAIVEGSVVRSGNEVRITAQLIDARDDRHLWAQSYDRDLRDILQMEGAVAGDIAQKVSSNLLSAHAKSLGSTARSLNLAAYDDYLKGQYYSQRLTDADLISGIGYLERSIQQDPNYAPAYTALAMAYAARGGWFGWSPPDEAYPKAKVAALRALALDPNLAEAHTVLGWLYGEWEWNWAEAGKELQRAVDLNPNSSFAHSQNSVYLVTTGQNASAKSETSRTLELDPLSPLYRSTAAYVFICLRQYDRAAQEARRAIELDPSFADAHVNLATALGAKGLYQEAFSEWLQYLNLSGDGELGQKLTVAAKGIFGSSEPSRKLGEITLRYFQRKSKTRYVSPLVLVGAYLTSGDKDHAFEYLEKAYRERSPVLFAIKVDPSWDPLRSDPRFQDLLRRMNFPPDPEKGH